MKDAWTALAAYLSGEEPRAPAVTEPVAIRPRPRRPGVAGVEVAGPAPAAPA